MINSFNNPNAFNSTMTYRFFIAFHTGDNEDLKLCGPERVVLKSFTIDVTSENFEKLSYLDDHDNHKGAWTKMWRATAHKFGQMGDCTAPALGVFGFDTHEIDNKLQMARLIRVWKWFLRHHGYQSGLIETRIHTPSAFEQLGDNPFRGQED